MKRTTAIVLLAIANFALAGTSFAQSNGVRATVPFDFTVGNKLLPAGTYMITPGSTNVIVVRNHDKPISALVMTVPDGKESKYGKLVFNRYGDQYFLSEILCQSAAMNLELHPSKQEKRVQMQQAQLSAGSQIFVAIR